MKMTDTHYKAMEQKIDGFINKVGMPAILQHKAQKLGKDTGMRFRWDIFYAANCFDKTHYEYLNDTHIDTALKHYMKTHGLSD